MLKNYIKIAWRNIWNNKLFSFINVISLAIGLSASVVIGLMVYYEFTFDTFHNDGDRIYRIVTLSESPDFTFHISGVSPGLREAAHEELTGIEQVAYFHIWNPDNVKSPKSEKSFKNPEYVVLAEPTYFQIFQYNWLAGNPSDALKEPAQVVISERRAANYFPGLKPDEIIGKTLTYNDSVQTTITGVVANFKDRSDLVFEEFLSLLTASQTKQAKNVLSKDLDNTSTSSQVFVKLFENTDPDVVSSQLDLLSGKHQNQNFLKNGHSRHFYLQALSDMHFDPDYRIFSFSRETASLPLLKSLVLIAIFLMLLGCFNFINLNTAQAIRRAKEIGIRKTLGGSRFQLIFQFLGETLLLTIFASVLSIFLSFSLLDVFREYMPSGLTIDLLKNPVVLGLICLLVFLITIAAGIYPGIVLASFKPVKVLKNAVKNPKDKAGLRKVLTAFQFTVAQVFIISTLLVSKQIHFLLNTDMGFEKETVAFINTSDDEYTLGKKKVLYEKLKTIPQLKEVSMGGMPPASSSWMNTSLVNKNSNREVEVSVELLYGDENYLDLYDVDLLLGRTILNDTIPEFVINETAMRAFGFENPQEALNKTVLKGDQKIPIVGIMSDFNQRSLETGIEAMVFTSDLMRKHYSQFRNIHFKLPEKEKGNWAPVLDKIKKVYHEVYPDQEADIRFVDETIAQFYERERRLSKLLNWATGLSVLISCLGLLGLVIHTTERRAKEIGIRKVLGASLAQLNLLLCKDFLKLVVLAYLIAVPFAWWGLHNWLQDYAYKTEMSWWVFALSGIGMVVLALAIMSFKTLRTALRNPVKSLRTE